MELPRVEVEGLDELVVGAIPVEVVIGGRLVHAEKLDVAPPCGSQQRDIILEGDDRGNVVLPELADAGVPRLNTDLEAAQRCGLVDAADGVVSVDGDRQARVGLREAVQRQPLRRPEDGVDDVELAGQHALLRVGPGGGDQPDTNAGLLLPELPEVDDVALELTVGVSKDVRRVVVVGHDGDGVRRRDFRDGGHRHRAAGHVAGDQQRLDELHHVGFDFSRSIAGRWSQAYRVA